MQCNQLVRYEQSSLVIDIKRIDSPNRASEQLDWLLSSKQYFKALEAEYIREKTVWTKDVGGTIYCSHLLEDNAN